MKKKIFIGLGIFCFVAFCLMIAFHFFDVKRQEAEFITQQNLGAPIEIPEEGIITYEEAEKLEKPMFIMFYVDWCTYCRRFMPTFGKLAKQFDDKYSFVTVNCDKVMYKDLVNKFHVMAYPMLFVYDKKIEHKFSMHLGGMMDNSILKEELNNYLKVRKNLIK